MEKKKYGRFSRMNKKIQMNKPKQETGESIYMKLTGKQNPVWADKVYNPTVKRDDVDTMTENYLKSSKKRSHTISSSPVKY